MTVLSDTLGAELPGESWSLHGLCGQWAGVCVCDGHTFAKGPQRDIKPRPSLQEVNGSVVVVPAILMGSLLLVMGSGVFW